MEVIVRHGAGFDWTAIVQALVAIALLVWALTQALLSRDRRHRRNVAAFEAAATQAAAVKKSMKRINDRRDEAGKTHEANMIHLLGNVGHALEEVCAMSLADFEDREEIRSLVNLRWVLRAANNYMIAKSNGLKDTSLFPMFFEDADIIERRLKLHAQRWRRPLWYRANRLLRRFGQAGGDGDLPEFRTDRGEGHQPVQPADIP